MPARKQAHDNTNDPKRSLSQKLKRGAHSAIESARQIERPTLVDLQKGLNIVARPYDRRIMLTVTYARAERLPDITGAIEGGLEEKLPFYIVVQEGAFRVCQEVGVTGFQDCFTLGTGLQSEWRAG